MDRKIMIMQLFWLVRNWRGEIFGLNCTVIYTYEVWQQRLRQSVAETPLPNISNSTEVNLLDSVLESAQTIVNRRSRTKLVAAMIKELIQTESTIWPAASLIVLPETFLAGLFLAVTGVL